LLLLCFGAGLVTGLSRSGDPLCVAGALVAALAWWWREAPAFWIGAVLAGRLIAAAALDLRLSRCEEILAPGAQDIRLHLVEPVSGAGATGAATVPISNCRGAVLVRWPGGTSLDAGAEVLAHARWLPPGQLGRRRGILQVRRFDHLASAPSVTERLRSDAVRRLRALYGARHGTVEALVLNRRGDMPLALRDRYVRAGLVHILSISGFHVGIIVSWCVLVGRLLRLTLVRAEVLGAAVAVAYVLFLGWPPPAARAALLAVIAASLHWRQRRPLGIPLLAVSCALVLLLDPESVQEAGAWLSAASLAGVLLATGWSDRALGAGWGWRMLAASTGAVLAAAPITAALFGTVSLAGVLLNFVAVPIAALAVPGLLLSLLASVVAPAASAPLAAGTGVLLGLLDRLAWWGGQWQWAAVYQPAELGSALPWVAAGLVAAWGGWGGTTRWEAGRRLGLALAVLTWASVFAGSVRRLPDSARGLTLHFLDVGQGDATAIRTPGGRWILIDAGPSNGRTDAGRRIVAPFLGRQGASAVALAILSHAHADHVGGLQAILDREPVGEVLEPGRLTEEKEYLALLDRLEQDRIPWRVVRDSARFELDGVRFTVLHPSASWAGWEEDLNEDSAVLLVEYAGFRGLFAGDAGLPAEARLRGRVGRVDLLKVGHHGSRGATGNDWLAELHPRVAIISSGRGNRYGHPHPETLDRLAGAGAEIWRTDMNGTITVQVDSGGMTAEGRGRRAAWPNGLR
jgi:competence protein ComEC